MRDSLGSATVSTRPFPRRFVQFALLGALMGVVFSFRAGLGLALFPSTHEPSRLPAFASLLLYPVTGVLGGALVAVCLPLTRWLGGAFLVGGVAFLPTFLGVTLIDVGHIGKSEIETAAVCSICLGGALGAAEWFNEPRRSYRLAHFWLFAGVCTILAWFMGLHWAGQWQALVAIPLFLIPVAFALMATFAASDGQ